MTNKQYTLKDVQLQLSFISVEQVNAFHSSSKTILKFGHMVDTTKRFVSHLLSPISVSFGRNPMDKVFYPQIYKFTEVAKYPELNRFDIPVPEGFQGNYLDYVEILTKYTEITNNLVNDVIKPFSIYVGQLVNNPTLLNSISYTHKVTPKDISQAKKELGQFFKPNGKNVEWNMHKCFNRMTDVKTFNDKVNQLRKLQNTDLVQEVKKEVTNLADSLDHLTKYLTSNQNNQWVKGKTMETLANLTYTLAEQVEFFAIMNNMVQSLFGAVERFNDKVTNYQS